MKINADNNNFSNGKVLILSNKKKKEKKNALFKNGEIKTSKSLADINEENFNISNSPYITYTNGSTKLSNIKSLKGKSLSNILLNNDGDDRSYEKVTSYTSQNIKSIKSKNLGKFSNNISNISSVQRTKAKKRVKFKSNFSTIIEVESYKKYNFNNYLNTKSNCVNCSCDIF